MCRAKSELLAGVGTAQRGAEHSFFSILSKETEVFNCDYHVPFLVSVKQSLVKESELINVTGLKGRLTNRLKDAILYSQL